jgi:hypothetical protein
MAGGAATSRGSASSGWFGLPTVRTLEELIEFDGFCVAVSDILRLPVERVRACGDVVDGLGLDEFAVATLLFALEDWNPCFEIPEQLTIYDLTLADLHHFLCVMSVEHVVR